MDSALDANETELGVLVLSHLLEMLADSDGLLDQVIEVLGNLGSKAAGLEDSQNLGAGDTLDLGDTVVVSKSDADLGGGGTLLGELHDLVAKVAGADLDP